ncbi:TPR repeat-containing protein [Thioploca ingrica]|uniref:protein O-GlcNAc transferase n=1 Tax=Thioploca ingrica TaxID=40754 RepID=A0A090AA90_9GAMM|nr:TPR repeat-containing protein [Thioploca ingrica]
MKIHRNALCPCGSGKRFKHCCGKPDSPVQTVTVSEAMAIAAHFQQNGQLANAEAIYRQILQIQPDWAQAYHQLGKTLVAQDQVEEAIRCYQQALQLQPDLVVVHKDLGDIFRIQGQLEAATTCFQRVLELDPADTGTRIKLATLRPVIMGLHQDILAFRQQFENQLDTLLASQFHLDYPEQETGVTNFYLAYHGLNDKTLQIKLAQLYEQVCPSLLYVAPHCQQKSAPIVQRKIKIGFISRFFKNHTIAKVMGGIMANLSREQFEIHVFFFPQLMDESAVFIQQQADYFETLPLVLATARQQIADKQLDILFYPDIGMESFTYFLAFSRLAPVQCTTWGHPVTTGIRHIDYFISTVDLETATSDEHYTEQLVRLPSQITFYYKPDLPPAFPKTRHDFGLAESDHLYICPQALFKFHPDFDEILAEILARDPQGLVILVAGFHQHWTELLQRRFQQTIPTVIERIRFLPRMTLSDYFNLLSLVEVMLDPLPFGGGNTSYEAFALGVPIVTLPIPFLRGRFTYACYRQMEIMDCVADNPQHYVDITLKLGTDPSYRKLIQQKILTRHQILYEDIRVVRELEQFFLTAVRNA